MAETTKPASPTEGWLDEELVERAIAASEDLPPRDRIRAGLEIAVGFAERDPGAALAALRALRGNHAALARLEAFLAGSAARATFGLGAAIQLARAELSSPTPDLRERLPELVRWLEDGW